MPEMTSAEQQTGISMNLISRLAGIFHSPKRVFSDIDAGTPWWQPFVCVSLLNMIVAYIVIPIQIQLFRLRADQMPKEQFEESLRHMQTFPIKYLGIIAVPVMVLIMGLIFAAASYIAVSVLSEKASFKKHLTIYFYASIVASIGILVSTLVVLGKGVENIRTVRDAAAPFGPAAFVPEAQKILYAVLSTLDVFSLWFYALIALGVMQVFRLSWRSALLVVIPIWLLSVLGALIGTRLGGPI